MNKLIALIAVLGFAGSANAADGADFSHSGEFRLKYKADVTRDFNEADTEGEVEQSYSQRLRWGTDVRAGEKMTGHFTLVHNAKWGSNPDQTPDDTFEGVYTASNNNSLLVNEAYMTWMASDAWMIKAGRGSFTMADGRVVSSNDYEDVSTAFDGAVASWDQEFARISFFGVRGADFGAFDNNAASNFMGFAADIKTLPGFLKSANVHYVQAKTDGSTALTTALGADRKKDMTMAGFSVAGDAAGFDYRANYEMQSGDEGTATETDISANMMDLEFGYSLPEMMSSRFHVGYHMDSGTPGTGATKNETYDGFYYDKHNNAGLMDVVGWGNLTYMRAGFTLSPMEDLTVAAEYFMFTQTEKDGDNSVKGAVRPDVDADEDALGTELDLTVTKKYSNNFKISGSYRMFSPGDEFGADPDGYNQTLFLATLTF